MLTAILFSFVVHAMCNTDQDCKAPAKCEMRKVPCATHPESSTCATRVCVEPEKIHGADRACTKDADCGAIQLECGCTHMCAVTTDKVDAVNVASKSKYLNLSSCSKEETASCAMAGACAPSGKWSSRCDAGVCHPQFVKLN